MQRQIEMMQKAIAYLAVENMRIQAQLYQTHCDDTRKAFTGVVMGDETQHRQKASRSSQTQIEYV